MSTQNKNVRITKPSYALRSKAGMGPVEKKAIDEGQKTIDENSVDFEPLAQKFLAQLESAITEARADTGQEPEKMIRQMTEPVMQLKANAAMFNAALVGRLTKIMLDFLETVKTLDKDIIDIVKAHHDTLALIISHKIGDDDGQYGVQLEKELRDACTRYLVKRSKNIQKTQN